MFLLGIHAYNPSVHSKQHFPWIFASKLNQAKKLRKAESFERLWGHGASRPARLTGFPTNGNLAELLGAEDAAEETADAG
jgi:hypothetical protein